MKPGRLLAPLALLVATAAPALASEQLPCTRFEQLAGFLAQTYGEKPVSTGLQADGQISGNLLLAGARQLDRGDDQCRRQVLRRRHWPALGAG